MGVYALEWCVVEGVWVIIGVGYVHRGKAS